MPKKLTKKGRKVLFGGSLTPFGKNGRRRATGKRKREAERVMLQRLNSMRYAKLTEVRRKERARRRLENRKPAAKQAARAYRKRKSQKKSARRQKLKRMMGADMVVPLPPGMSANKPIGESL